MSQEASKERLLDVVAQIYDSALDRSHWPVALEAMCGMFRAIQGSISILNTTDRTISFAAHWTEDQNWPYWSRLLDEKYAALMPFYEMLSASEVGEVFNTQMQAEMAGIQNIYDTPFFKDWALPSGRRDNIGSVVMKTPTRFGAFALHTSTQRDLVSRQELDLAAQIVPHVCRAISIGDLLQTSAGQIASLQATLDRVSAAVIVTDANCRILHANASGEAMLLAGEPIASAGGRLACSQPEATAAIHKAVAQAWVSLHGLGQCGIGVPLRHADGRPGIAHVMPLSTMPTEAGFGSRAVAAIFIAPSAYAIPTADALVALFGLTPTESRVMLEIAKGGKRSNAAQALGIADSTIKTHLDRIFSKTGTNDQAALARIVMSLSMAVAT